MAILDEVRSKVLACLGGEGTAAAIERVSVGIFFTGVKLTTGTGGLCFTPVKDMPEAQRLEIRQQRSRPIMDALHEWMLRQRQQVAGNSATAKVLDYSLKRWGALTRFIDDGQLPVDNNWIENQIRPIAVGRGNWLFAGSLRAGQRAAAVMSLIQSARLNGHDPYAYLKDVLTRLPTHRASRIEELLAHRWQPAPV